MLGLSDELVIFKVKFLPTTFFFLTIICHKLKKKTEIQNTTGMIIHAAMRLPEGVAVGGSATVGVSTLSFLFASSTGFSNWVFWLMWLHQ